jgi:hypothetical protein
MTETTTPKLDAHEALWVKSQVVEGDIQRLVVELHAHPILLSIFRQALRNQIDLIGAVIGE